MLSTAPGNLCGSSAWVLGLLLGIALIAHGLAGLGFGFLPTTRKA